MCVAPMTLQLSDFFADIVDFDDFADSADFAHSATAAVKKKWDPTPSHLIDQWS